MKLNEIIAMLLADPRQFWKRAKNRMLYHFHLYILRTPFYVTQYQWRKDDAGLNLRLDYSLDTGSVVFDLGGFEGEFAAAIHERYGATVYLFEPSKKYFDICRVRFADNPKIKSFHFGLGDADGEFSLTDDGEASSVIVKNQNIVAERVRIRAFAAVFQEFGISEIDLLKMNIEGSEYALLPHIIQNGLIRNIRNLQVQFHHFIPGAAGMRDAIRRELAKTHIEQWCYPFVFESWRLKSGTNDIV